MLDDISAAVLAREEVLKYPREQVNAYLEELKTTQRHKFYRALQHPLYPILRKIERKHENLQYVIGAVRARFNAETDYVIVEGQLLWHIGVVGIVASRVLREFHRPTIILGGEGDEWRGSGRSIAGLGQSSMARRSTQPIPWLYSGAPQR